MVPCPRPQPLRNMAPAIEIIAHQQRASQAAQPGANNDCILVELFVVWTMKMFI